MGKAMNEGEARQSVGADTGTSIGHFEIGARIGEGGMGEVYRATDLRLDREVALKLLPESLIADRARMDRFRQEAKLLASMNHPNIAAVHGVEEAEGRTALVMELVEGEDLAQRLRRGPVPTARAATIGLQVAAALEAAHDAGIIHRDLKPGNVRVSERPGSVSVKVLDFGLAVDDRTATDGSEPLDSDELRSTSEATVVGTAPYMSPEQASGLAVDKRTDIWAFGALLYEVLSGRRAFQGESVSLTLVAVMRGDIDWSFLPGDLPPGIERLLRRCLERDPARRLRDIGEARIALEDYLRDPEAAFPQPAAGASKVPRWAAALGAVLAAVGAAGLAGLLWQRPQSVARPTRFEVRIADEPLYTLRGASVVLSADGERLAWTVGEPDRGSLFVRTADERKGRQLARSTSGVPRSPFFSPEGDWVAYFSDGHLMKVPFGGGAAQTICAVGAPRGGSWGEDGTIVFADATFERLYRVDANGGEPEPLPSEDGVLDRYPHFLPDGEGVVFTSLPQDVPTFESGVVRFLDLESGRREVLHRGGFFAQVVPTGHLVFASRSTLFAAPFDVGSRKLLGAPTPVIEGLATNPLSGSAQYSFSATGDLAYVAAAAITPTYPLLQVDRSGRRTTLWSEEATYVKPRVSPDGRRVAVTVLNDNNWDIRVLDFELGSSIRLTFDEALDTEQVWSPDGQYIVFSSDRGGGVDNLYRKRSDGSGDVERLTESQNPQWATDWSLSGQILFMELDGGDRDLHVLDLDSGETRPYLQSNYHDDFAAFSPDERWVVYSSNESGRSEVYVRPFPEPSGRWQLSDDGGSQPLWSADGREVFYRSDRGVVAVAVDGSGESFKSGPPRTLFEGDFRGGLGGVLVGNLIFNDYDLMPDADSFLLLPAEDRADETRQRAHIVLDWFEELRALAP